MVFNENENLGPCSAYNKREYRFSLTDILPYVRRFCPYPGEHGSEKTHILAYFMQCWLSYQVFVYYINWHVFNLLIYLFFRPVVKTYINLMSENCK